MCSTVLNIYVIYYGIRCLKKLGKKNFKLYQVFMCYLVLNIVQFIFWDKCSQNIRQENHIKSSYIISFFGKMTRYSQRFLNYIKSHTLKLHTRQKQYTHSVKIGYTHSVAYTLSKNWFYFFFLVF